MTADKETTDLRTAAEAVWQRRSEHNFDWLREAIDTYDRAALASTENEQPTEQCPTCWQPVPVPRRGEHDYGIPLASTESDQPDRTEASDG